MNEIGQDLAPKYTPSKFGPWMGLAGQNHLINALSSHNEQRLPITNSAEILTQSTIPTNFHHNRRNAPRRAVTGEVGQNH